MAHTAFNPELHGFAFNNTWTLDLPTTETLQKITTSVIGLELGLLLSLKTNPKQSKVGLGLTSLAALGLLIANRRSKTFVFGLCGGMSFTALDYFLLGLALPVDTEGIHPTSQTPDGRALRSYI